LTENPYYQYFIRLPGYQEEQPVKFGAKFDLSVDDSGYRRIEKISYDAYNESEVE
jgi:hypothetical protein